MSRTLRRKSKFRYEGDGKINPDGKAWSKAPKWYKKMKKRERKAKEKDSLIHYYRGEKEIIPEFKNSDTWEWL